MGYQRQSGDDLEVGGFLQMPGWYHLCATALDDPVTDAKGQMIQGAAFRVQCEVLAGTVSGQEAKPVAITFWEPKPSDKDGGKFRGKVIDRFALAIGLIEPNDKNKAFEISEQSIVPRQFIAQLEHRQQQGGAAGKYLEVAGLNIYHIDDPDAGNVPKCAEALQYAPRRTYEKKKPAIFAGGPVPATSGGPQQTAAPSSQPTAPAQQAPWNV